MTRTRATMAGATALVLVLSSCGGSQGGEDEITVATNPNEKLTGLYVAIEEGFLEEEGLDVDLVETEGGRDAVAAVVSGGAQFTDAEIEDVISLTSEGDDTLVMTHNLVNRVTLTLVMRNDVAQERGVSRDSDLDDRLAALEGLTLGVTSPGSSTDDFMRYYLRRAGLDPERDAEIIAVGGGPALLAALEEGQIDAYHLSPPTPFIAEAQGFGTVLINGPEGDVPEFEEFVFTAWAADRGWAEDNPETAEAFGRAIAKGVEFTHEDPERAAEIAADYLGADAEETRTSLEAMLPAMPETLCLDEELLGASLETLHEAGISEEEGDPTEGALWTNDYTEGC